MILMLSRPRGSRSEVDIDVLLSVRNINIIPLRRWILNLVYPGRNDVGFGARFLPCVWLMSSRPQAAVRKLMTLKSCRSWDAVSGCY